VKSRLEAEGIVLVGGGADEAPEVYKRLPEVLAAHADTIRVKQRLKPIGVAMAGRDVLDPYKDRWVGASRSARTRLACGPRD
jgi:tRNA-splicing ligase RtcB (3'-phosphate/5'-hydroxy nucleic acid ligase)